MVDEFQKSLDQMRREFVLKLGIRPSLQPQKPALTVPVIPQSQKVSIDFLELGRWLNIIKHPCVIIVIGSRGSGKSAMGYKILEYLKWTARPYVVGIPQKAQKLLPDWIGSVPSLEDAPPDSVSLMDEAYMALHSRSSTSQYARKISNLINLSRQRGQTLVFITQEARQVDLNIASSANVIIVKNPGILQVEFERIQFRKILAEAQKMFNAIDKDKNKWAYVYAPMSSFAGMMSSSLPAFWTPGLSKGYAEANLSNEVKPPKKMAREEKVKLARDLRRQTFSLGEIAKMLGVSKSTVKNYLDDYPYQKRYRWRAVRVNR